MSGETTQPAELTPQHEPVAAPLPRFAVVDVETSGLSTRWNKILQVAVVTVEDGRIVDEWSSLVKLRWPLQRVGPRRVHGIGRRQLRHAPGARQVFGELARRLDGAVFTAHNVSFDWSFVARELRRLDRRAAAPLRLCTLRLSRSLDPGRELSHRLIDVCTRHGIPLDKPHDALFDARATAAILGPLLAAHQVRSGDDLVPLYERR